MSETLCPSPPELRKLMRETIFSPSDVRRAWEQFASVMAVSTACQLAACRNRDLPWAMKRLRDAGR